MKNLTVTRKGSLIFGAIFVTFAIGAFVASQIPAQASTKPDTSRIVELTTSGAKPSAIAVTKGDYVQFATKDGRMHEIGQGSGDDEVHHSAGMDEHNHLANGKLSDRFGIGEAYKVQFNQTGTFEFHDHLNPKLSATVIVYEAGTKLKK